ncbi:MAG: LVIVD repeat-containing protein [Candidatus Hydrogenedentota bacterium]
MKEHKIRLLSLILWLSVLAPTPAVAGASGHLQLVSVLEHPAVTGAHDIEVRGSYAYVAGKANKPLGRKAGRFAIVHIADPQRPKVVGSLSESDHPALHNAQTVLLLGDTCLLGADALLAIDIADPSAPRITACIEDRTIARINGMILWNEKVIAVNKDGFLDVFSVSEPRAPRFLGAWNTRKRGDLVSPHDLARFGKRYVVVPGAGKDVPVHFAVYQVAGDDGVLRPAGDWRLAGTLSDEKLAGANRVVVHGRYAYVACHYADTIGVVALADPEQPALVTAYPTQGCEPDGLALAGDVLFIGAGKHVEAVDVSNPLHPQPLAHYEGAPLFTLPLEGCNGNAHDLVVQDGFVYVTAQRDGRIGVLRFR